NSWVAASSFTAQTLAEHGIPRAAVHVVPYGVDSQSFPLRPWTPAPAGPLRVLFVGSMIQRKGLCDLLEAVRAVKPANIQLTLAGRGFIDRPLLEHYRDIPFQIRQAPDHAELVQLMHSS